MKLAVTVCILIAATAFADRRGQLMEQGSRASNTPWTIAPFAYYKMDDGSGPQTLGLDVIGNNNMQVQAPVTATTGLIAGGAQFPNFLSFIGSISGPNSVGWTNPVSFTMRAWVKTTSLSAGGADYALHMLSNGTTFEVLIKESGGHALVAIETVSPSTTTTGSTAIPLNQWAHLVFVYDRGAAQMRLYLNGAIELQVSIAASLPDNAFVYAWGNTNFSFTWQGIMDEVGLWQEPWSAGQASADYNGGIGRTYP